MSALTEVEQEVDEVYILREDYVLETIASLQHEFYRETGELKNFIREQFTMLARDTRPAMVDQSCQTRDLGGRTPHIKLLHAGNSKYNLENLNRAAEDANSDTGADASVSLSKIAFNSCNTVEVLVDSDVEIEQDDQKIVSKYGERDGVSGDIKTDILNQAVEMASLGGSDEKNISEDENIVKLDLVEVDDDSYLVKADDEDTDPEYSVSVEADSTKRRSKLKKSKDHRTSHGSIRKKRTRASGPPNVGPFECKSCQKVFKMEKYLTQHLERHIKKKTYLCNECDATYTSLGGLNYHVLKVHTTEKPFTCKLCGKGFVHKGNLHKHLAFHSGEKQFDCEFCGKGFVQHAGLVKHVNIHLSVGNNRYKCTLCKQIFTVVEELSSHVKKMHSHNVSKVLRTKSDTKKSSRERI